MSENVKWITPGQELEVEFELKCDGSFEVVKILDNGDSIPLSYRSGGSSCSQSHGVEPYVLLRNRKMPLLCFPNLHHCDDVGRYRVIYQRSKNFKPNKTTEDLWIQSKKLCIISTAT